MKQEKVVIATRKSNLFAMIFGYKRFVGLMILFTVLGNFIGLLAPRIIAQGIDAYTKGTFVVQNLLVEFSLVALFVFLFTYLQGIIQIYASEIVARDLRAQITDKISQQNYAFVMRMTSAKLLTNLTSDVDAVKMFVAQVIGTLIASIVLIIGASILLLITNLQLGFAVLLIVPIIGGTFFMLLGKVKTLFGETQKVVDWLNKVISESILGAALIRVLNSQKYEYDKFVKANSKAKNIGLQILGYFSILVPIITFVASLATLVILSLGGHFVITGSMSLGDIAAFNSYVGILIFPIIMIGFMSGAISRSSASYERIAEVFIVEQKEPLGTIPADLTGSIKLSRVTLRFGEKQALKDITLEIKPGTRTAIIGPTAAGKTQLLYILNGLVKPDEGEVLYSNTALSDLDKESFHQQMGFVFQDSIIFNITLRENIAFSESVTKADLEKAIQTAELSDFIKSLPKKLDTIVSERGTSLSGGQKQRIMLARALALNPKVLLLDDFTARVDTNTERKILANVAMYYPDVTLISVTQKVASVTDYDQCILLMEGEVLAVGAHKELMKTTPEYVQLYESQQSTSHYEVQT
ncbi:MAG TPA: ABC transporter ATP-binding protein [Candidatus Sulfotelmatobacter sp.]|jgi:ATP-binding cassette subfamily B protein|nr:ABC transporter ATP-binding protein [Candidatus Sulfotelmatobacter sp.]